MKYVYKLYMFSTNYSIKETREVYQNCHGIFSSLEEAEKALTDLMPIKWKFEKVDEDETDNGRDMSAYTDLLHLAIESIVNVKEESDIASLFTDGESSFLRNEIAGLDDFELITFLIIK